VTGVVYLVGAGPGDPDLITVRGRRLLEQADVVVHDRLGTEGLLGLCRPGAELVNAGKAPGDVAMTQEEINAALVAHAREGRTVVRLKGGDPFVFGRGGEEAEACAAAGVAWAVVPGVTSAIAAPGAAGVPVTHRGVATSFTVVTGHEDPAKEAEQTDWSALARVPGTLVILMGMGRLPLISAALVQGGRSPDQPAAAVQWGTTPRQRSVVATLGTLAGECVAQGVGSPAVVVVGDVAGLGLAGGGGPLAGRRVVVTRARAQASDLSATLRALGAEVIELPTIRVEPIDASSEIDAALDRLSDYDLVVLTSANGVDCLFERLAERGGDARSLPSRATVVAIGPATAARLAEHGVRADLVPERFVAEGILDALAGRELAGVSVLVARAREARADLVDGLRARGARVDEVALYETVSSPASADEIDAALSADYLTFTSSSTVRNFMALLGGEGRRRPRELRVVSIGPVTSDTARAEGLTVHREAEEFTIPGLVAALVADSATLA
jgi:uroporphyrinogen III methyltransferase/synthase